jgi:predicted nucleotidyltransferase component of viral defense system
MYNQLQTREIFHLEFLRWFGRKAKREYYALKGGSNLRFFFNSLRYSEDMDIDVQGIKKYTLLDITADILKSLDFANTLKPFGIERVVSPNIAKAKQTETTQRFKVHLVTYSGEDLFTKIEFSRRGFAGGVAVGSVLNSILRAYKLPPLLVPHYNVYGAVAQKIEALSTRRVVQARDIFDLYLLSSQYEPNKAESMGISRSKLKTAHQRIFEVSFEEFNSTVISYLLPEDQKTCDSPLIWDEIRLKTANLLEGLSNEKA